MTVDEAVSALLGQPPAGRHRLLMSDEGPPGTLLLELVAHGEVWEMLVPEDVSLTEVEDLTCPHCGRSAVDR